MGDWLGTRTVANHLRQFRSFKKARIFARGLGLKSESEWREYCKSGKRPEDIPAKPYRTYASAGWAGMGDWLGTGEIADRLREYRPFKKARSFVRGLGLKSESEWREYCKSGKRPEDIPAKPYRTYASAGWAGMGDWLGTERIADQLRQYRSFEEARAFARSLHLKSRAEWRDYCKSGKKPEDIPAQPYRTYVEAGWAGMGDWLGTGTIASFLRQYRPFEEARAFARSLHLKSRAEWDDYSKSGNKPEDIPANPVQVYANDGWAGVGDWLGTGTIAPFSRQYRSFEKARSFVRNLHLKSESEWRGYCKSGKKPEDIPATPNRSYAEAGWAGMGDWLGYAPYNQAGERDQAVPSTGARPDAPDRLNPT
jgi:hypothetical protein